MLERVAQAPSKPSERSKTPLVPASEIQTEVPSVAARVCLAATEALKVAFEESCSERLVSVTLNFVTPSSASLHSAHGYARVHTSIYIYIYIHIFACT